MKSSALLLIAILMAPLAFAETNTVETIPPQEVAEAALNGQIETIKKALAQGFDVNTPGFENRTPLMFAAYNGRTEIVKLLIGAGAEIDAQDSIGTTPLMFAASAPNGTDAMILLLDAGAEINRVDTNEHFTALMWAAAEGQMENVKLLLEKGADFTLTDTDGDTAETFASKGGHAATAEVLKNAAAKKPAAE